jgi:hypothetical protein
MITRENIRVVPRILFAATIFCFTLLGATSIRANSPLILSTGPFNGTVSEGWESFPIFGGTYLASPATIMNGNATIANSKMAIYQAGNAFLGTSGRAQVADGTRGLMLNDFAQTATITFSTPITSFGSYFAASTLQPGYNADPAIVTVSFFGQSATLLDTETFTYSHSASGDGGLDWHGWSSAVPVYSISLQGDFLVMDGVQAFVVPEPSATALSVFTALMIVGLKWAQRERVAGRQRIHESTNPFIQQSFEPLR